MVRYVVRLLVLVEVDADVIRTDVRERLADIGKESLQFVAVLIKRFTGAVRKGLGSDEDFHYFGYPVKGDDIHLLSDDIIVG